MEELNEINTRCARVSCLIRRKTHQASSSPHSGADQKMNREPRHPLGYWYRAPADRSS